MFKQNLRLIAAAVAVATVATLPFAASAADLTVNYGDPQMTISAAPTYDTGVVNTAKTNPVCFHQRAPLTIKSVAKPPRVRQSNPNITVAKISIYFSFRGCSQPISWEHTG